MECYYFTSAEYGVDDLRNKRIKVSSLAEVTDPPEMFPVQLSDKKTRRRFFEVKAAIAEKYGVLCFSRNWHSPVQWAHYADNYTGLCLGFEVPDNELKEINYIKDRIKLDKLDSMSDEVAISLITTKFKHWKYEGEFRAIYPLDSLQQENQLYFQSFSDSLKLKKVIIGCHSELTKEAISEFVSKRVEVFYSRLHDVKFSVIRDRVK